MASEGYNGWTNYETWNVALWLGNEQWSELHWRDRAEDVYREAEDDKPFSRKEKACITLAEELKQDIEERCPPLEPSMYADLLNAALSEVNWHEIAEHYIDDVADEIDAEEIEDAETEANGGAA